MLVPRPYAPTPMPRTIDTSTYDPFRRSCSAHRDPVSHGNMSNIYLLHTRVIDPVRISPSVSHAPNNRGSEPVDRLIVYGNRCIIAVRITGMEIPWKHI